jgi:hypothetical protein
MSIKTLCIFLPTGKTFTFKNIELIFDSESVLVFDYVAMDDGLKKRGIFLKSNISGWSLLTE